MKILTPLAATIAIALSASSFGAMAANSSPSFVKGELGLATSATTISTLKQILSAQSEYALNGNEDFSVKQQWTDELGKRHTRLNQTINGLKVYGASMIVHADLADANAPASAQASIYAVSGRLAVNNAAALGVQSLKSMGKVMQLASELGQVEGKAELAYVYLPLRNETKLAWKVEVIYNNGGDNFGHDAIFYGVNDMQLLTRHAKMHRTKNWKTYDLNNASHTSGSGTLLCRKTQSCGDASAQRAHDGASSVYDFYNNRFGRKSVDNNDLTLKSSVHTDFELNNAYWYNGQMFYGDGDGSQFNDLTLAHDVIGHELTHGVTENTANLIYANASGALNEGWSDILGAASESYRLGSTQPDWRIGEEVMASGGALRYMKNPTQDGYSTDWYPDRIPFVSNPSNQNDQGGVHGNSGIANLAFALSVDGGSPPRVKSSSNVPKLGLAKAEQIFYRALNTYMTQSSDFFDARTATAQSAQDLYGATEKTAIETAWCAVGVGACPGTGGGGGGNTLENGVAKTGLASSSELTYTMAVPAGATNINFVMSGGSGDADLYVKFGSAPTDNNWDCRPYKGGNSELCSMTQNGGTYHVRLAAYSAFSGVSLTGSYSGGSTGPTPINDTTSNISVSQGSWKHYTLALVSGYDNMTVTTSGGSGDVDLFVRHGSQPTSSSWDCRPYKNGNSETCSFNNPASGTWHISLNGYSTSSGVTLNITATP
ncbi:MAG: M4 family metallopeptidase [Algicola sp.]|nr:M4 family metallopeptidase [Algicola sp.]